MDTAPRSPAQHRRAAPETRRFTLVGGGIAALSAAAFLIRDGDVPGHLITIIEETDRLGGSLDGAGSAESGYVLRGGRMLESKYLCTFELFDSIPALDGTRSVTQEIYAWNETLHTNSKARLMRDGVRETAPAFGLSERQILTIERLVLEPEALLGRSTIVEQFDPEFFRTDFWFMWCTTFAFQPWHSAVEFKRYLERFVHLVGGFNRLQGIMRTEYNQYDSFVRPLQKWLEAEGVVFRLGTRVVDLGMREPDGKKMVATVVCEQGGQRESIPVAEDDLVFVTLGSMTEGSSLGGMDKVAPLLGKAAGGAWKLWERLAAGRPEFGHPEVFTDHIAQSKWVSFTLTLHDPTLLKILLDRTGNVPGEGGLISFPESPWLASIVVPHQPHFIGQPADTAVIWGYGLSVEAPGEFVPKPMQACTGREILTELLGQLRITTEAPRITATATCIPCMMPFITSQFLARGARDRPEVVPEGWGNLAFIGQYCELPRDVVFTVEYSIRSAQVAVGKLLGLKRQPPAVYRGEFSPRVLLRAFRALHGLDA
jgi:oleate hydratase